MRLFQLVILFGQLFHIHLAVRELSGQLASGGVELFQFRSQTPLQKGMPAEGTILQPVPDKLWEGAVVSALSVGKTINSEANNI